MKEPDAESFGGFSAIALGIGGSLTLAAILDRSGYKESQDLGFVLGVVGLIAIPILFIPCCIFWSFVFLAIWGEGSDDEKPLAKPLDVA